MVQPVFFVTNRKLVNKTVLYTHEAASSWASVALPDRTLPRALLNMTVSPLLAFHFIWFYVRNKCCFLIPDVMLAGNYYHSWHFPVTEYHDVGNNKFEILTPVWNLNVKENWIRVTNMKIEVAEFSETLTPV